MKNDFDWTDARLNRLALLFVALSVYACADAGSGCGGGCGGCGGTTDPAAPAYEYPAEAPVIHQGAQIHVTERGLDFVEENLVPIISDFLPGGLSFCIPPTDLAGVGNVCSNSRCADGSTGCQIAAEIASVSLVPVTEPDSDRLRVDVGLVIVPGQNRLDVRILLTNCTIDIETPAAGAPVSVSVYFDVAAPPGQQVSVDVPTDQIDLALESFNFEIDAANWWDFPICEGVDLFSGSLAGLLEGFVGDALDGALGTALCTTCPAGTCADGATCNGDGICIAAGSDQCVPLSLGLETEFDLGSLLAGFAPGLEARLGIMFMLAGYADMVGPDPAPYIGMDLAADFGMTSEPNVCVPFIPPPASDRIAKSSGINTERNPSGSEFAIGVGLHRQALDMAMWSIYNSGVICLSVGTDTISQVSTSLFGPLLPSLGALTNGQNRPMYLQIRPQDQPRVTLGSGEVDYADDGTPILVDPLMTISVADLAIDFYAFVEERYTRLFTLTSDLVLPIGLDVNADNQLVILLPDDLTSALTNIRTTNGELLAQADVDRVATLLPSLIGGLLPALTGSLLAPIDIPSFSGFELRLPAGAFTSVDDNEMLAIFGDLGFVGSDPGDGLVMALRPEVVSVDTRRLAPSELQATLSSIRHDDAPLDIDALTPEVVIDLETFSADFDERPIEYSYRIGEGLWSFWHRGDRLVIRNPALALQGRYQIEVRARYVDEPYTTSAYTTTTEVIVDYEAPHVQFDRDGLTVRLDMWDTVSPVPALAARWRVERGDWHTLDSAIDAIDLTPWAGGNALLEVEVTDEAGQQATRTRQFNLSAFATGADRAPDAVGTQAGADNSAPSGVAADPVRSGCSASGRSASGGWLLAVVAMALVGRRRRRSVSAALAGLGLAALLAACGNDPRTSLVSNPCDGVVCGDGETCDDGVCVGGGCELDTDCPDGSYCDAGVCVEGDGCASDDECEDGYVCLDGDCVEDNTCGTDADCPDGQQCLDGACVPPECVDAGDCAACEDNGVATCVGGVCGCEAPCAEGCADGTACCFPTNSCVDVAAECDPADCPVGTRMAAVSDPEFNNTTCEATANCECVELDPLPIGFIGRNLDAAVAPDQSFVALSAWNATYDDLMVGIIGDGDEVEWTFVDGVPTDSAVTGSLNGPRGGIGDDGDSAGEYSAISVGPSGELHVAYLAENADGDDVLRYAFGAPGGAGFDWSFVDLDGTDGAGMYPDVVLTGDGRPAVVYMAPGVYDGGAMQWHHELRVRFATSIAPASTDDWGDIVVIDEITSESVCGGQCTTRQSCRLDTNVCQRATRSSACDPGCGAGEECFENEDGAAVCSETVAANTLVSIPAGIGLFADAAFLADGSLGVAHYDANNGNLRFTQYNPSDATSGTRIIDGETVGDGGEIVDLGDVGRFPDLYVDTTGAPFIAYSDATRGQLLVADLNANTSSVAAERVRCYEYDGANCVDVEIVRIGDDSALADTGGSLSVVYQDATRHEIWESPRDEFGWQIAAQVAGSETDGGSTWGWHLNQAVDGSGRFVVGQRIDNHNEEPARDVVVLRP